MAHFLERMVRAPEGKRPDRFGLRVRESGVRLASDVRGAFESASRRKGLLGRDGLAPGEALVIAPCSSIHTAFMRFAIDVIFAARTGRVLRVALAVPPWRVRAAWGGFAVIEMAACQPGLAGLRPGMHVELEPSGADRED